MKILLYLVILTWLTGCSSNSNDSAHLAKKEYARDSIPRFQNSRFFKDYDIFRRRGIEELNSDTLKTPFFQVYSSSDTTFALKIYHEYGTEEFIIPKGNQTVYSFHNITDCPRHIFSKIEGSEIVRYGYESNPFKDSSKVITPSYIHTVSNDSLFFYDISCLDTSGLKGRVFPFTGYLDRDCREASVNYHPNKEKGSKFMQYYRNEKVNNENPSKSIYGYPKKFKHWNGFHDLKAMI